MKRCPRCNRIETDDLAFCRVDGTPLIRDSEAFEPPTAILTGGGRSAELTTGHLPNVPSIAVLPFVNMSADAENEYFCDGLAEELLNALTRINDLKVAARTSAFSFQRQEYKCQRNRNRSSREYSSGRQCQKVCQSAAHYGATR